MSDTESSGAVGGESLKHRLRDELRKYLIVSAYLYVCFGALQFFKAALLQDAGVHYLALGVAVVKALIVGKFLLIGDALRSRALLHAAHLLGRIARRVVWLLSILALLTIAEELVAGWIHGQSFAEIDAEFRARSMPELLAEVLLMGLILLPLVATSEVNQALGPGVLRRMLLSPPGSGRGADDFDNADDHGTA